MGRPRVGRRLPVDLSKDELAAVFRQLDDVPRLFAQLLHGTGARPTEGHHLRIKDVASVHRAIAVRDRPAQQSRIGCRSAFLPQIPVNPPLHISVCPLT